MKGNGPMGLDKDQTKTEERCQVYHQPRRRERTFKDRGVRREKRGKRRRVAACVCVHARAVQNNLHGRKEANGNRGRRVRNVREEVQMGRGETGVKRQSRGNKTRGGREEKDHENLKFEAFLCHLPCHCFLAAPPSIPFSYRLHPN